VKDYKALLNLCDVSDDAAIRAALAAEKKVSKQLRAMLLQTSAAVEEKLMKKLRTLLR